MKRFVLISLLLSVSFSMGELVKWDPNVNTGDVYHEKYEVVPFKIEGLKLDGYYHILPLPDEKVLI
jgi:hypothetical protein